MCPHPGGHLTDQSGLQSGVDRGLRDWSLGAGSGAPGLKLAVTVAPVVTAGAAEVGHCVARRPPSLRFQFTLCRFPAPGPVPLTSPALLSPPCHSNDAVPAAQGGVVRAETTQPHCLDLGVGIAANPSRLLPQRLRAVSPWQLCCWPRRATRSEGELTRPAAWTHPGCPGVWFRHTAGLGSGSDSGGLRSSSHWVRQHPLRSLPQPLLCTRTLCHPLPGS